MTSAAAATWLLKRFVTGPHAEAIVGDLLERFNQDGSVGWLWRQVLLAIVLSIAQEERRTLRVYPKGVFALAGIMIAAKFAGAMFVVGMIWIWMVAPLYFTLIQTLGGRRSKIPRRL